MIEAVAAGFDERDSLIPSSLQLQFFSTRVFLFLFALLLEIPVLARLDGK